MRHTSKGFSLIEMLLVLVVAAIVMVATTYFLSAQNGSYKGQKERVALDDNLRTTMDFITRFMKGGTVMPAWTAVVIDNTAGTCSSDMTFYFEDAFGVSTGANTTTTLNDASQTWTANQWKNYLVVLMDGGGRYQSRYITGNPACSPTGTTCYLTVSAAWGVTPDATSTYKIISIRKIRRVNNNLIYSETKNTDSGFNSGVDAVLADNISCFTVARYGTTTRYDIKIVSQTPGMLPDTGKPGVKELDSSIVLRN